LKELLPLGIVESEILEHRIFADIFPVPECRENPDIGRTGTVLIAVRDTISVKDDWLADLPLLANFFDRNYSGSVEHCHLEIFSIPGIPDPHQRCSANNADITRNYALHYPFETAFLDDDRGADLPGFEVGIE